MKLTVYNNMITLMCVPSAVLFQELTQWYEQECTQLCHCHRINPSRMWHYCRIGLKVVILCLLRRPQAQCLRCLIHNTGLMPCDHVLRTNIIKHFQSLILYMTLQYCATIYVMYYKYKHVVQKLLRGSGFLQDP